MVQFLSIFFFSWISSIFVGFFISSRFFVSLCIWENGYRYMHLYHEHKWRGLLASFFGRFTPEENPLLIEWAGYVPEPA